MAHWHSVDLTDLDLAPLALAARRVSETVAKRGLDLAKDATYVSIGIGLLTFQRAQVQRREIERALRY